MALGSPTFDPLVANAARLRILAELARSDAPDFVTLRQATRLTDGNLVTHARRLSAAGLVTVRKSTRDDGRAITTYHLTAAGREALELHARELLSILTPPNPQTMSSGPLPAAVEDDWVD